MMAQPQIMAMGAAGGLKRCLFILHGGVLHLAASSFHFFLICYHYIIFLGLISMILIKIHIVEGSDGRHKGMKFLLHPF